MLNRSPAFDQAIVNGANIFVEADMYRSGKALMTLELAPGAKVHLDETTAARRTFSGAVPDLGGLQPHLYTDPLAPYGTEMFVYVGVQYLDGTTERVPAGVFRVQVSDVQNGLITLTGVDRSMVLANALNEKPYTIAPNTPLDTAIGAYLHAKYPTLPFTADAAAHQEQTGATPIVYLEGGKSGDPWKNMMDLATANGRELYIDAAGTAVLRIVPQPAQFPVLWSYAPGAQNLHLGGRHVMDTTNVKNVWIVEGGSTSSSSSTPPFVWSVEVVDPASPIFPDPNNFGRRPQMDTSAQVLSTSQAQDAALAGAAKGAVGAEQLTFNAVPHPAHEPGDVVSFRSDILGLDLPCVLSKWDFQLDCLTANAYTTRLVAPFGALAGYSPGGFRFPPGTVAWILGTSVLGTSTTLY